VTNPAAETPPVVIVYGPTASGKSVLALRLAESLDGVVINADSLQLYAELQILTARPGPDMLARAPHRLYGVLPAARAGSVAWWRDATLGEISAARAAGSRAIVTGGTGMYLTALIEGLSPVPPADEAARALATSLYAELGGEAFRAVLADRDPVLAARLKPGDRQRLIRAWEVAETTGVPLSDWQARPRERGHDLDFTLIGLDPPRALLYATIDRRFESMLANGALDEAARFAALGLPESLPANKALGLPELRRRPRHRDRSGPTSHAQLRQAPGDLVPPSAAAAAESACRPCGIFGKKFAGNHLVYSVSRLTRAGSPV
jgi:tRNA dimethylallyltransferase